MNNPAYTPSPWTERLVLGLLLLFSHGAVAFGGLVRPEALAWLHQAETRSGWDAADWWALLLLPWSHPAAPIVVNLVWSVAGFLAAYIAVRRTSGAFVALGLAGFVFLWGYPAWSDAFPDDFRFWLLPASLVAMIPSLFFRQQLAAWRERIARYTVRPGIRVGWVLLLILSFFMVAEQVRVGVRGVFNGKFPYQENGDSLGFDPDLNDLRVLRHAGPFLWAVSSLNRSGVLFDNELVCLAGHGATARFVCRVGAARPDVTPPRRDPKLTLGGWTLASRANSLLVQPRPGLGGIVYAHFHGRVDGEESAGWFATRRRVLARPPYKVELAGPLQERCAGKDLLIEVECHSPAGVTARAMLGGEPLTLVRRELAAGDRLIVRFGAKLPPDPKAAAARLEIEVVAPQGLLDLDLLLQSSGEEARRDSRSVMKRSWGF